MIDMKPIIIKCKRCNRSAKSTEFILDPVYKMMVCPNCVKDRKNALRNSKSDEKKPVAKKPVDWDREDEFLEKAYNDKISRNQNKSKIKKLDNGKLQFTCNYCNYVFIVNHDHGIKPSCPYCGNPCSY